jgi:catecholate siderophore receptor
MRDPAFYERDSFNLDRLEVLRGSASMLFGRGSTGGAVNQVSKQPHAVRPQHQVDVTVGSGELPARHGRLQHRTGEDAALRINLMGTRPTTTAATSIDKHGAAATYGLGHRHGERVHRSACTTLDNDNGIHYGLPWLTPGVAGSQPRRAAGADPKQRLRGGQRLATAGSADLSLTLSHLHRFGGGGELADQCCASQANYDRDLRASAIRFANATLQPDGKAVTAEHLQRPLTVLTRGNNNKIQDLDNLALQSDYTARLQWAGMKHQVAAGVDTAADDFRNFGANSIAKPTTRLGNPDDGAGIDEFQRVATLNRTFESRSVGLYAQDLVQLSPSWKILAGLRWDHFEGDYNTPQLTAANGTVTPPTHRERTDSLWSRRFGVLYQPNAFASYHLSYGTSFNTSGDTYQYDALGSNTPPEGSVNYEFGGKLDLSNGNLSLRFALFHTVKTNERNRDSETVNPTNYVLSGQRHAAGIELDIAGRITPAWEVYVSYAFIPDAEIDKGTSLQGETPGTRPGLTPRHSGTVWTTYKLGSNWRLGGGLNARSSDAPQLVTAFKAPGYVTADLMAEYTLGDLTLKANLTNLTDKLYADMLYRGHYVPGKPRTVQVTASWRF